MSVRSILLAIALSGGAFPAEEAGAQTMYRCGNKYQDHPCEAGVKGKTVSSVPSGASSAPASAGRTDAECAQRGKDALKIVWAREGGATEESLLAERGADRDLIGDVYRRRGAASQIQAQVEADCVALKEKAEQAAAKAAADAARDAVLRRGGAPTATQAVPASSVDAGAEARAGDQAAAAQEAERKKARCAQLNADMDNLISRQRQGNSAAGQDSLAAQRRDLSAQISRAGC